MKRNKKASLSGKVLAIIGMFVLILLILGAVFFGGALIMKHYKVWSYEKDGLANLKKAEWEKKIRTEEAKALKESSKLLAEAEIERAKGVAEANRIIADGLKDNEEYLRYLWINKLGDNNQDVIYIPTEAGMPILEAQRLK